MTVESMPTPSQLSATKRSSVVVKSSRPHIHRACESMRISRLFGLGSGLCWIVLAACSRTDDVVAMGPCSPGEAASSTRNIGDAQQMTFPCNYSGEWMCGDDSCGLDMTRDDGSVVFSAGIDYMSPRTIYAEIPDQMPYLAQFTDLEVRGGYAARFYFSLDAQTLCICAEGKLVVELKDRSGFASSIFVRYPDHAHEEVLGILATIEHVP